MKKVCSFVVKVYGSVIGWIYAGMILTEGVLDQTFDSVSNAVVILSSLLAAAAALALVWMAAVRFAKTRPITRFRAFMGDLTIAFREVRRTRKEVESIG